MERFQHHPDGQIIVENQAGRIYIASLVEFDADIRSLGLPGYPGIDPKQGGELYRPGILHAGFSRDTQHEPSVDPKILDRYIAAVDRLIAAREAASSS